MSTSQEKIAVITRATGGIGFQVVRRLGKDGYTVILASGSATEANVGSGPKSFDPAKDYLFPIPLDEIISNPNLTQNLNY